MNDQDLVDALLQRREADDSDFKSEQYRLDGDHEKSQFIKDIVAMANIPGAGSACIVIGVLERAGKVTNVPGVSEHPDEAESRGIVAGKVDPTPGFSYRQVTWKKVELGLVETARMNNFTTNTIGVEIGRIPAAGPAMIRRLR